MRRVSLSDAKCPVARALDLVGDWWSVLILRDALDGAKRFDDFQSSLPIAPNMLTRRLTSLVEVGLLEKRKYSDRPVRHEYVLTPLGEDFEDVVNAFLAWGNRNLAPEGPTVTLVNRNTLQDAQPILVDELSGKRITSRDYFRRNRAKEATSA
jgi:DNA-binding HxlR family transcriptional regulator